jgi:F0F1-type ATP synthase assembly protein I
VPWEVIDGMKLKHRFFRTPTRSRGRPAPAPVSTTQAIGITIELGSLLAICVLLGLIGGQTLDAQLGTTPLMTLLGVIAGLACTLLGMLRQYRAAARSRAAELAAANALQRARVHAGESPVALSHVASGQRQGG